MPSDWVYIVTGTTRGLGLALSEAIIERGALLFSLSRAPSCQEGRRRNITCDLRFPDQINEAMTGIFKDLSGMQYRNLVLINNAGILKPIGPIEIADIDQMEAHFSVNLQAPIQLCSHFIRASRKVNTMRRIINITSGAARHAYAGWALYCAGKAALAMATDCIALEQRRLESGVGICSLAPGVLDTDMQRLIRETDADAFPSHSRFTALHEQGRLQSPRETADLILALDAGGQFKSGGQYDLRDVAWQTHGPVIKARKMIE